MTQSTEAYDHDDNHPATRRGEWWPSSLPLHSILLRQTPRTGLLVDTGLETEVTTRIPDNTLCQLAIATDAETDAIPSVREPRYDRFAESLMMIAGLPLSDADKAEAVKRLLREVGH